MVLMQNAVVALTSLGFDTTLLLANSTPMNKIKIQNEKGELLAEEGFENCYVIERDMLMQGFLEQLADKVKIELGSEVSYVQVSTVNEQMQVDNFTVRGQVFHNKKDFDVVVGAEGFRSPLCAALNPAFKRSTSRVFEILTVTRNETLAQQIGRCLIKTNYSNKGLAFGLCASTSSDVVGFLQFDTARYNLPTEHYHNKEALRSFVQEQLKHAPAIVQEYLASAAWETIHLWHPCDSDLPPHASNAILVGDAAHPLLPFTSQGVAASLEDAVLLPNILDIDMSLPTAFDGFTKDRRNAVQRYIQDGRQILIDFVSSSAHNSKESASVPLVDGNDSSTIQEMQVKPMHLIDMFRLRI